MKHNFTVDLSNATTFNDNNKKKSIFRKIYLWWTFEGRYLHLTIKRGIKNIIRWFPVIWKDRDYDDHYIWEILKTKLRFQAKSIGDRNIHTNAKRDSEIMFLCSSLIDKIQSEFYLSEYMDYHHSEIYFIPISNDDLNDMSDELKKEMEGGSTLHFDDIWENFEDYFKKYPHAYREVTKNNKYMINNTSDKNIAINIGYYLHNKAKRILFEILEKNTEKWWD